MEKLASGLYDESIFVTHASRADVVSWCCVVSWCWCVGRGKIFSFFNGSLDVPLFVWRGFVCQVLGYLSHCKLYQLEHDRPFPGGLLVCGEATDKPGGGTIDENKHLIKAIRAAAITDPSVGILFVNRAVQPAMSDIERNVAKLNAGDVRRTDAVVQQYSRHIDLDVVLQAT